MSKENDFVKAYSQSKKQGQRPEGRKKNIQGTGYGLERGEAVGNNGDWFRSERGKASMRPGNGPEPDIYGNFHDIPKVTGDNGRRGSPRKGGQKGKK